jgi:hypothetical protein
MRYLIESTTGQQRNVSAEEWEAIKSNKRVGKFYHVVDTIKAEKSVNIPPVKTQDKEEVVEPTKAETIVEEIIEKPAKKKKAE